jgi:molybdate transport system permease protein
MMSLQQSDLFFLLVLIILLIPFSVSAQEKIGAAVAANFIQAFTEISQAFEKKTGVKVASIAVYEAVEALNYRDAGMISLCFLPISYVFLLLVNRLNRGV